MKKSSLIWIAWAILLPAGVLAQEPAAPASAPAATENPAAYKIVHKGVSFLETPCATVNQDVADLKLQAPEKSPAYAKSLSAVAGYYFISSSTLPPEERMAGLKHLRGTLQRLADACAATPAAKMSDLLAEAWNQQ